MAWWRASPIDEKEALKERQPDISSKACSTSEWQSIMYTEGLATAPYNSNLSEKVEKDISSSLHNHCMHVTVTKSEAVIVYNASYNIMLFAIAIGKYLSICIIYHYATDLEMFVIEIFLWSVTIL